MINIDNIFQLAPDLPANMRLPLNPIIHQLAKDDCSTHLLSTDMDVYKHIAFLVIDPTHIHLLTNKLFQFVHCVIIKDIGVVLNSKCSTISEGILENAAKWAPFKTIKNEVQFYSK
jgi:hypothetical protein